MSFDLDDPLGDLLSDGSNDSFFGETPKKSTVGTGGDVAKKDSKVVTSTPKSDGANKNKMDELFGIKKNDDDAKFSDVFSGVSKTKQETKNETSGPSSVGTPRVPGTPQLTQKTEQSSKGNTGSTSSLKKSQTFDRDDDILSDLGFDVNKPKAKSHSKASILDDILGVSEPPSKTLVNRPKTGGSGPLPAKEDFGIRPKTSVTESKSATNAPAPISRQSTITSDVDNISENTVIGGYLPSNRRSGRRQSSIALNDPLGLFTKQEEPKTETITKKTEEVKSLPTPAPRQEQISVNVSSSVIPSTIDIDNKAQILAITASETGNALASLKHQEISLAVAAQMKAQELALTDIQKRQETLLKQQEQQFSELLQKQIQRQGTLEENIKRQQERINAHINLLMTQPVTYFTSDTSDVLHKKESKKTSKLNAQQSSTTDDSSTSEDINKSDIDLKAEIKQLELEKLRLEDLLSNINANHENELAFMENSYKKQIKLLEESLQKTETRLRAENKSLQEYYFTKIDDIESEKQHLLEESKTKLKTVKDEYEQNMKDIRKKYENDLEAMENNYKDMIQNIRQSKLLEFSVIQENGNYLDTLRNAFRMLENANEGLGTLKVDLHEKIEKVYHERESQLRMRETKVEQMEKNMTKDKEKTEEERTQLLELVKSLEMKLGALEQTSNEENWNLKQKMTGLEVERASFEREKIFIREQLTREQKRLEELKQLQSLEYDRTMKQIEEERMNLITEKTKLETNARLQKRSDSHTSRAEIEAALKVAEEAGRQADIERERLIDVQKQYETKRRELSKEEHKMRSKQNELDEAMSVAIAKEKQAEVALKNIKTLERNVLIKLQVLQRHKKEMHERESKLSMEKLNLSRERMQMEEQRRKMLDNRCSLCKIGEKSMGISNLLTDDITTKIPNNDDNKFMSDTIDTDINASLNKLRHETMIDEWEIDLNNIPNITDASDNLLDADLLLLKFDVLNSSSLPSNGLTSENMLE